MPFVRSSILKDKESPKLRALRVHVPTCLACLRANVPCVLACQRALCAYVLTCQRTLCVYVPTCLACFACLRAHVL